MKGKMVILIALSFFLVILAGYSFFDERFSKATSLNKLAEENTGATLKEINGLKMDVNHARSEPSHKPDSHFVIVDITIENTRDTVYEFSLFKLTLVDKDGYAYSYSSDIETKGILDGQIHPGRLKRGEVAFEVPVDTRYEFVYTDHLRTGQIMWEIEIN